MRERGERRQRQALPGSAGSNPFGVTATQQRRYSLSFADAIKRAQWIALDLAADRFALFTVVRTPDRTTIVPRFDSEFPVLSLETRLVTSQMGEELATHVLQSSRPIWWSGSAESQPRCSDEAVMHRLKPAPHRMSTIAFPVHGEHGQSGLISFSGPSMSMEAGALMDVHARCFSLFQTAAAGAMSDRNERPAISNRELDCLRLAADGRTSEEIAELLGLSVHTANQYLASTTQKLDAVSRMQAVATALRLGLID